MSTVKLLIQPIIRVSWISIKSLPHLRLSGTSICGNGAVQTWLNILKLNVHNMILPTPYWNLLVRRYHHFPHGVFLYSGGTVAVYTLLRLSVIVGSIRGRPRIAYCTDGFEFLDDDLPFSMSGNSDSDEDDRDFVTTLRKFLMPVFCLLTVLVNWGQPMVIAAKLTFLLYATRPTPLSVYLVVEQPCYAKNVQVEDWVFLCIARVELDDQNVTLLGILGSWWMLPCSSLLEPWKELYQHSTMRNEE
ncbi:OLC1v1005901C1 [Oldenlandia corymbosa var. corymbosa]|uniref:OLC1v1005901C1 n=1 Tax=Oldenlandia corymbosa var. corymbosa TaxID=529605 RepID=A0AAV1DFP0_OLDCO|nr:OLC1v1005901C1 [Oldenlandia corymbosa var. corymbosa]